MRTLGRVLGLSLLLLSVGACSSSKGSPASDVGDDGGGGGTIDAPLTPLTTNGLTLTSEAFATGSGGNLTFVNVIAPTGASCAVQRQNTSCLVQDCRGVGAMLQGVSAGEVDLNDNSSTVLKVEPGAPTMLYAEADSTTPPWAANDSLQFVAAGADVPPFTVPLTAPGPITLARPAIADGTPLAIDPTMDLVVAWAQTASPGVTVELIQSDAQADLSSTLRVLCEFQGGAGSGIVPAVILGLFASDTSLTNTIHFGGSSSVDTTLGGYWVHASVVNAQAAQFAVQ